MTLQKLQEKKAQLAKIKTIMWVKRDNNRFKFCYQRRSSSLESNTHRRLRFDSKRNTNYVSRCHACEESHRKKDYFYKDCIRRIIQKNCEATRKNKRYHKHKGHKSRAYNVENNYLSKESNNTFTNLDESVNEKVATMFKKKVNKIHDDDWVANTGAFLHIID